MGKYLRKFRVPAGVAVMEVDLGRPPLTRARAAAAAGRRRRAAAGSRRADALAEKSPSCRKPARAKAAIAAKVGDGLETRTAFNSTRKYSEPAQIMERDELGTAAKAGVGRMSLLDAEIEGFFAAAEMRERKRFMDKYNYDVEKDVPVEGRYQWVRLIPEQASLTSSSFLPS